MCAEAPSPLTADGQHGQASEPSNGGSERSGIEEKNARGLPLNPVARFHLGNGAELHRINWLGDTSAKGLEQAAGLMVNYLYVLNDIERNHENYTANASVARSGEVKDLVRKARKAQGKGDTAR